MARDRNGNGAPPESVISIIGPGMRVVGDCSTDGTIRIEGSVEGSVTAGKAVVVGKDGVVSGAVNTQDAVVAGKVVGSMVVESRLELQATSRIEGELYARRLQLEEGAILNGTVDMGEKPAARAKEATRDNGRTAAGAKADSPAAKGSGQEAPPQGGGKTPAAPGQDQPAPQAQGQSPQAQPS